MQKIAEEVPLPQFIPDSIPAADTVRLLPSMIINEAAPATLELFNEDSLLIRLEREIAADSLQTEVEYRPSLTNRFIADGIGRELPVAAGYSVPLLGALLVLALAGFAGLRIFSFDKWKGFAMAGLNNKMLNRFYDEEHTGWLPPLPLGFITFNLIITGFIIAAYLYGNPMTSLLTFELPLLLAIVHIVPVLRAVFIISLGSVFNMLHLARLHILISYISQALLALLLLPFFLESALDFGLPGEVTAFVLPISFAVMLIYQFIRVLGIMPVKTPISLFYIFLYLCTLEILPLLLLYKFFSR